jgi:hypothetical protein
MGVMLIREGERPKVLCAALVACVPHREVVETSNDLAA